MAAVTVFVDDAVRGRLPEVCAKDGVPEVSRLRVVTEVGRSTRLGVLVLLVLLGPIGWVLIAVLLCLDSGEKLAVELPLSAGARVRRLKAGSLRDGGLALASLVGAGLAALSFSGPPSTTAIALAALLIAAALVAALVGQWRLREESVGVALDASRRWVTLRGVHPEFARACNLRSQEDQRI